MCIFLIILKCVCMELCLSIRLLAPRECFISGVSFYNWSSERNDNSLYMGVCDDKEAVEAMNPWITLSRPKRPPTYNYDDPLSNYRIDSFKSSSNSTKIHLTSLPAVQIEHQDKGKLIPFKDGREILSFYNNKLLTFLSNFNEWTKVYNTNSEDIQDLSCYNPLSENTYYALVFYCAWQSESIALIRAIDRLLGKYRFIRDPPITHEKKKQVPLDELLEQVEEMKRLDDDYKEKLEYARANGLPEPEPPDHTPRENVVFNLHVDEVDQTTKILDYSFERFNYKWWMPKFGKITYNRIVDKAFNEIYNTSYKGIRNKEDRDKYILSDVGKREVAIKKRKGRNTKRPVNINFVFVRLANSLMLSNSKRGIKRQRKLVLEHGKEIKFNEIMLRLLITEKVYYKDMPLIQLYKCINPINSIPLIFTKKTHEKLPFDDLPNFYKTNPFDIAAHVNYGLPKFRKCNHLAIPQDFELIGNVVKMSTLPSIDAFDDLLSGAGNDKAMDFTNLFSKNENYKGNVDKDLENINPMLHTLSLLYKYQFKKILDSRPVPVKYYFLNP